MTRDRLLSPLAVRFTAAFVVVAVAAVAVFAGLTLAVGRDEVSDLVADVHRADAVAAASAARRAWVAAAGWDDADLSGVAAVAAQGQAEVTIRNVEGLPVALPAHEAAELLAEMHGVEILEQPRGEPVIEPVVVDGRTVGAVELRFPASHLPAPQRQLRDALARTALLGAAVAVMAATTTAVIVARRVTRPVSDLTTAAEQLTAGRRDVRVDEAAASGELAVLAATFNRMADALAREDALRRQLVADVAHEVRTPLSILRGTTEALVDGVSEPDDETLSSLHDEVLRLGHLVADLETLASADAAGLEIRFGPVDLAAIAAAVADLARPAAEAAGLELRTDLRPAPASGDEHRLRQAVTALVHNALAYTPSPGCVTLATRTLDGDVEVAVSDTGPGVEPDEVEVIFERFARGRASSGVAGSGIGLAVARELVTAHRGTITVADAPCGGACFTVHLPVRSR